MRIPTWGRIVAGILIAALLVGVGIRGYQAVKVFLFGNTEAKEARANTVVAEEQAAAAHDIGVEATNTVTRTYERHVTIDRTVKEAQNEIADADNGQQMDPAIDAAVATGLCQLHDDLCRR